jgi:hypothetical protein
VNQSFLVPLRLPGANDLLKAKGAFGAGSGKRWNGYNAMKQRYQAEIEKAIRASGITAVDVASVSFQWRERYWRRDPDNVSSGGRKLILDSLVKAGIIPDDGPRYIKGLADTFCYGVRADGVLVTLKTTEDAS